MDCPDPIASLLPFHANGTLSEEERRKVEEHLAGCSDCRDALALARRARETMAAGFDPALHVQAQLLAEYVDGSPALGEETRTWVASHLKACDVCASVVPVLRRMPAGDDARLASIGSAPSPGRLWTLLKATVLHPVPAMAYLVLVVAGLVWLARSGGPGTLEGDPAALLAPPVAVHGEVAMRGEAPASPPQRLEHSRGPLRLALQTDLDPEERAPGAARLRLELKREAEVLWSATVEPESIPPDGVLEMMLDAARFPHDAPLELVLRRDVAGEQAPLFFRRILISRP